jgi:hypothetical protein
MAVTIPGFSVGIGADASEFLRTLFRIETESKRTADSVSRGFGALNTTMGALTNTVRGFIGAFTVDRLVDLGRRALDTAGNLEELALQAGVSTTQLQVLQFAGLQTGVGLEEIQTSFARFARNLEESGKKGSALGNILKQLDIETKNADNTTRSAYAVFGDIAEAVQNASSQTEQLTIAQIALGRGGARWIPVLAEGREGLQQFAEAADRVGFILGQDLIAKADQASDTIATLQGVVGKGFQIGLVEAFAESVNLTEQQLRLARDAAVELGQALGRVFLGVLDILGRLEPAIAVIRDTMRGMESDGQTFLDFLEHVGLASPNVESLNRQISETAQEMSDLAAQRDVLARAGIEAGIQPEDLLALRELNARHDQLNRQLQTLADKKASLEQLSVKPLEVSIHEAAEATKPLSAGLDFAADKTDKLTGAAKRLQDAGKFLTTTSAQEERFAAADEATKARFKADQDMRRRTHQDAKAEEDAFAEEIKGIWQGVGQSIQSTFADTYEQLFTGGLTSFQDFADSIKQIFIRLAADIAAAMTAQALFGQLTGVAGLFGGAGAGAQFVRPGQAPSMWAQGSQFQATGLAGFFGRPMWGSQAAPRMGAHGMLTGGGVTSTGPGGMFSTAPTWGQGLGGGAAGLFGGLTFGGMAGQAVGGGVAGGFAGAGAGALSGGAMGMMAGPWGAAIGAGIGALAGGLLGGLSGGSSGARRAMIGGGVLGGTGSGLAAQLASGIDTQIQGILTSTQETVVNAALATSQAIKVEFNKDKGLSEGDKARIAAARLGPAATALGISATAVTGAGGAEAQMAAFQEALTAQKAIKDLVGSLTPFTHQVETLRAQFDEAWATAAKYGISLEGVVEAQTAAFAELNRQQRLEAIGVAQAVGAMDPLTGALQTLQIQMEDFAAQAVQMGIPLDNLTATHQKAAQAIIDQYNAQQQVVDNSFELLQQRRLEIHAYRELAGIWRPLDRQLADLQVQFENAWREAARLGEATNTLALAHARAAQEVINQHRLQVHAFRDLADIWRPVDRALADLQVQFENAWQEAVRLGQATNTLAAAHTRAAQAVFNQFRLEAHAFREFAGTWTPLQRELADLQVQFENAWLEANRLGESTANLAKAHQQAAEAVIRQHQAQMDAMALSITDPFTQLLEPLRALGIELDRSLLNPLEQFNASAQNFRDIAAQALAGNTEAIQQLEQAGRQFIATATSVGASPAAAAATREVQNVLQQVMGQVQDAQAQAGRGIEGTIWAANQRVVDTLGELIVVGRLQIEEMRRLQRGLT